MFNPKVHRRGEVTAGDRKGLALVFGGRAWRQAGNTAQLGFSSGHLNLISPRISQPGGTVGLHGANQGPCACFSGGTAKGSAAGAVIRGFGVITMFNPKVHRRGEVTAGNRKSLTLVFGSRAWRQAGDGP